MQMGMLADGVYDYVIRYTPMVPGAEEQSTTFKVRVDTQKPVITSDISVSKMGLNSL